jgi:hypothetical protein
MKTPSQDAEKGFSVFNSESLRKIDTLNSWTEKAQLDESDVSCRRETQGRLARSVSVADERDVEGPDI